MVSAYGEDSAATGVNDVDETDTTASESGAVYVFARTNGIWSQQAYFKASNSDAGDRFGYDLAIDGDRLVVGAIWESSVVNASEDNSVADAGSVYAFDRSMGDWL